MSKSSLRFLAIAVSLAVFGVFWAVGASGDKELVWLSIPVSGLLWAIGGTWEKLFRRLGVPILITGCVLGFHGWTWWLPAIFGFAFLGPLLPFTLIGDGIKDNPFNWAWIWIWGAVLGQYSVFIGLATHQVVFSVFLPLIPCVVAGVAGTLSNVKATARYFPWKLCEVLIGSSAALPAAFLLQ